MHTTAGPSNPPRPVTSVAFRAWVGERLAALRLRHAPGRHVDFGRLEDVGRIDLDRVLDAARLEAEWRQVHNELQDLIGKNAVWHHSGNLGDQRALYHFVRYLRPKAVLEIGTLFGVSTLHIAAALRKNGAVQDGAFGQVTSVDITDVDDVHHAWRRFGFNFSPRNLLAAAGLAELTEFVTCDSAAFLATTDQRFDFAYLDGSTAAAGSYRDLQLIPRVLKPGAVALLHTYYPGGLPLWPGERPITGPWRAIRRLHSERTQLAVRPLGDLPWGTKGDSHATSLALLGRQV